MTLQLASRSPHAGRASCGRTISATVGPRRPAHFGSANGGRRENGGEKQGEYFHGVRSWFFVPKVSIPPTASLLHQARLRRRRQIRGLFETLSRLGLVTHIAIHLAVAHQSGANPMRSLRVFLSNSARSARAASCLPSEDSSRARSLSARGVSRRWAADGSSPRRRRAPWPDFARSVARSGRSDARRRLDCSTRWCVGWPP